MRRSLRARSSILAGNGWTPSSRTNPRRAPHSCTRSAAVYGALDLNEVAERRAVTGPGDAQGRYRSRPGGPRRHDERAWPAIYQARGAPGSRRADGSRRSFVSAGKCLARSTSKWPARSTTWESTRSTSRAVGPGRAILPTGRRYGAPGGERRGCSPDADTGSALALSRTRSTSGGPSTRCARVRRQPSSVRSGREHTRTLKREEQSGELALNRLRQYEEAERLQREVLRVAQKATWVRRITAWRWPSTISARPWKDKDNSPKLNACSKRACQYIPEVRQKPHSETAWTLASLASGPARISASTIRRNAPIGRRSRCSKKRRMQRRQKWPIAWDGLGEVAVCARTDWRRPRRHFDARFEIRQAAGDKGHGLAESTVDAGEDRVRTGSHPEVGERLAQRVGRLAARRKGNRTRLASLSAESVLGRCRAARGRFDEAEVLLTKAYETLARHGSTNASRYAAASLVVLYESWKKPEKAAVWRLRAR